MNIGRIRTQGLCIKPDYWGGQAPPLLKYWGASGLPGPPVPTPLDVINPWPAT